jgi:superfamily II DNA or RNA helicase
VSSTIVIYDKYCQIINENDINILTSLDFELSFKVQGAEYSPSFKKGRWDGFHKILTGDLKFPYGLLQKVKDFYFVRNLSYDIEDKRVSKEKNNTIDILGRLKELGCSPYDYQLEVLDKISTNDCGIIRVATGGGKSNIAALMTAFFGKKTIIYVIGTDLLYQTHKTFTDIFNQDIGIVGDGNCIIKDINIVSVWSVGKSLGLNDQDIICDAADDNEKSISSDRYKDINTMLHEAKVQIFDECHLASCSSIQAISKNIFPEHIYGMSASPWRDDNSDLLIECVLGKNIIDISASYLIERGFLVKPIIKFLKVPPPVDKLQKSYPVIYKKYITDNPVRNGMVVRATQKLVEQGYQTLVLYNNVSHGKTLYEAIKKTTNCILLSGKDSSDVRESAKRDLENKKINCIITSKIFDIGINLPSLSGLVLAGGGKSSVRALQRIGRVIRKYPSKTQAAIVDFYDQAPFVKDHSIKRAEIYMTEPAFEVHLPKKD